MRLKVKLTEIEWDVDGYDVDEPLPDRLEVYVSDNVMARLVDHVLDEATEKTGFCILNAEFEYIQEET